MRYPVKLHGILRADGSFYVTALDSRLFHIVGNVSNFTSVGDLQEPSESPSVTPTQEAPKKYNEDTINITGSGFVYPKRPR